MPTAPTVGAGSKDSPLESNVLLRPPGPETLLHYLQGKKRQHDSGPVGRGLDLAPESASYYLCTWGKFSGRCQLQFPHLANWEYRALAHPPTAPSEEGRRTFLELGREQRSPEPGSSETVKLFSRPKGQNQKSLNEKFWSRNSEVEPSNLCFHKPSKWF